MRRMPRVAVALMCVLVVALSGCSWSKASIAAQVGGQTVTSAEVDQLGPILVDAFAAAGNPFDKGLAPQMAVQGLVVGTMLDQAGAAGEAIYPAEDVQKMLTVDPSITDPTAVQQLQAQAVLVKTILAVPNGETWLRGEMAMIVAQNSSDQGEPMVAQALSELAKSTSVTLNPRFGAWDSEGGGFSAKGNSLSEPAPTAAPAVSIP